MKTFKSFEEIKQYYNEKTNTYEFVENLQQLDVELDFDLNVNSHIFANNIKANNIKALNIKAGEIKASQIAADNIKADDIHADAILAGNIDALDICANHIEASDIIFGSVCFARETFVCKSIKGLRENNKYFCLDNDVEILSNNTNDSTK